MSTTKTCKCGARHRRSHASCHECHAAYMRNWRPKHPLTAEQRRRSNARSYANVYLRRGKIQRGPCEDCGVDPEDEKLQMHHADYDKPLDITWLCRGCAQDRRRG